MPARGPIRPISHTDPPYIARPRHSVIAYDMYLFKLARLVLTAFCFVLSQDYPGPEKMNNIIFVRPFYLED